MSYAPRRQLPLRPLFVMSILTSALLLLAYGWIERRWATAGFYLAILTLVALFLAPPIWSYTRTTKLDESPDSDASEIEADEPEIERF
jgi:hypothetical protein